MSERVPLLALSGWLTAWRLVAATGWRLAGGWLAATDSRSSY